MNSDQRRIQSVPTNIITGFLGVGKTSTILHLLKHKPTNERWAVLVNEFGEIGVDGSLYEGRHNQAEGVFIREVPGGCMCCAAGVPMQVALNQLLNKAQPDRLLIEPTGLGHPKEVLQVLSSDTFKGALNLQRIITLVDARKLSDKRYTDHETFNQQIAIADIVVGNKQDLYEDGDSDNLSAYVKDRGLAGAQVLFTQHGKCAPEILEGQTLAVAKGHHHHHAGDQKPLLSDIPIPECGYIRAANEGEGFYSLGWRFAEGKVFDYDSLVAFLQTIKAERMKAVFITNAGLFSYNLTNDGLLEKPIQDCKESRMEVISRSLEDDLESQLFGCLAS